MVFDLIIFLFNIYYQLYQIILFSIYLLISNIYVNKNIILICFLNISK